MSRLFRLGVFAVVMISILVFGYISFKGNALLANYFQLILLTIITIPLIVYSPDYKEFMKLEEDEIKASSQTPDLKVVQGMTKRMVKSLNKHLNIPCAAIDVQDSGAAYEIELLINDDDMLLSYQEVAIVPYERVRDVEYWQQITKILINNYRVKQSPPA